MSAASFFVLFVRAAAFFMHKNIGVIILHGHMCVSAFTCAHKTMHAHTNTYTYMQIQQARAHACVHCKTLQNFAMHSKYHHGGIMLYTLRRIALHSCIHTSIHTYIYTLHCLYYIRQYYTVHRTEHYNACQYNTLQPTTWMHLSLRWAGLSAAVRWKCHWQHCNASRLLAIAWKSWPTSDVRM